MKSNSKFSHNHETRFTDVHFLKAAHTQLRKSEGGW